jgi:ring-1,2-phenylacetyl-CoA epoxidase subunit PaaC
MTTQANDILAARMLALADDELILAHRNSEWTGHAPILEEDIGLANIAQDELGHAMLWYNLYTEMRGGDPDQLVFFREAEAWRNVQLVELPKGDWAFTMLRQFLFDAYELVLLARLVESQHSGVAQAAAKIQREEIYHYRHSSSWVRRLGLGAEESHQRMQRALDEIWPYTAQLFFVPPDEAALVQEGYFPSLDEVRATWLAQVQAWLADSDLLVPALPVTSPPRDEHTPHLVALLDEMQKVARLDATAEW